jgi:hypothetical protein
MLAVVRPPAPGLQILNLDVNKELLREDDWRLSMVSKKPPEINPTLGRGCEGPAQRRRAERDAPRYGQTNARLGDDLEQERCVQVSDGSALNL